MADIVDAAARSNMMSGIRGSDTKPELAIRCGLHRKGFRYRLHEKSLPGKPDLVFPKYRAVVFVNGCFWHRHDCHLFKWPKTRQHFWREKISANAARDRRNYEQCERLGWKVLVIWECALKGRTRRQPDEVINTASNWLQFDCASAEITGRS